MMRRIPSPDPYRWPILLTFLVLLAAGGCGRSPSRSNEVGKIAVFIEPQFVNYHSMAFWWTTTFADTISLQYRLYIWEDSTARSEEVPSSAYVQISHGSAGGNWLLPVTGLEPAKTFFVWIVAYRESPAMTIVGESERASFKTCTTPYLSISRQPRRVSGHRAVGIGNYVYVIWPDQVFERFDPASNDWTTLPQVPHAHTGFGATALGGKLYVIGGENGSDVDVYDPASGAWATRAPIPNGVSVRTAVTLRDTIFTFASTDQLSGSRPWASYPRGRQVMAYVPQSDAWFPRSDGPGGSIVAGPIVPFQGKLYLFGGYSEGTRNYSFVQTTFSDSIYAFNPDSNLWSFFDRIPDWRVGFHAVEQGGAIYLLGGLLEWHRTELTWTVPPGFAYDGAKQGWYLRTVPGVPLDFGEDASLASAGSAIYFVNGGNRWPGTMGRYAPGDDACGVDIIPWEDTIPYGIPFTEGGTAKSGSTRRLTVGEPRPRR